MRITKIVAAAALVWSLCPSVPVAAFGMGGAGVTGMGGASMSGASMAYNGNSVHGSPAATNPAVALVEARQRDAQVTAEIDQARKAGKNVRSAETCRQQGEKALGSGLVSKALDHFNDAEQAVDIHPNTAAMGYSGPAQGSVTSAGPNLSGAIVP